MTKPCAHLGCQRQHRNKTYCSYACRNACLWAVLTSEERHVKGLSMARARLGQQMNRMLQRVKVLADAEDARLILAWRYGLRASKARRYRGKATRVASPGEAIAAAGRTKRKAGKWQQVGV